MNAEKAVRVLPAKAFDALAASAKMYGGIGRGLHFEDDAETVPCCIYGHAMHIDGRRPYRDSVYEALNDAHIYRVNGNDGAVGRVNKRLARGSDARVSFADWCAELNVVRGES